MRQSRGGELVAGGGTERTGHALRAGTNTATNMPIRMAGRMARSMPANCCSDQPMATARTTTAILRGEVNSQSMVPEN